MDGKILMIDKTIRHHPMVQTVTEETMGDEARQLLAEQFRAVLKDKGWSFRRAEQQTGVPYTTIERMSRGMKIGPEYIVKFVNAIEPDKEHARLKIAQWLLLAGWDEVARVIDPDIQQTTTRDTSDAN